MTRSAVARVKLGLAKVASMHEIVPKERSNAMTLILADDRWKIPLSTDGSEKTAPKWRRKADDVKANGNEKPSEVGASSALQRSSSLLPSAASRDRPYAEKVSICHCCSRTLSGSWLQNGGKGEFTSGW